MSSDDDNLANAIRALAETFISRLPLVLTNMQQELTSIKHDENDVLAWKNLHRHLHSIAGSAGTFGYGELGDRAREIEHRINAMLKAGTTTTEPTKSELLHDQQHFMNWVRAGFIAKVTLNK